MTRRGQPEVTPKVGGTKIVQAFRSAIVSLRRLSSVASTKAKFRSMGLSLIQHNSGCEHPFVNLFPDLDSAGSS